MNVDQFYVPGLKHPNQWTVYKRSEEERAGRLKWVEMSVRHEMEGLQDDTETCCDWWFGNGGPGSGRIEDAKIFTVTKTVSKEGKANISIQTLVWSCLWFLFLCSLLCYRSLPIKW